MDSRTSAHIRVTINGEAREIPEALTVAGLIAHLGLRADRLAIEHNRAVLPRSRWSVTPVNTGDSFEIVHLVGGG